MLAVFPALCLTLLSLFSLFFSSLSHAVPANFPQAKVALKEQVYFDQNQKGALGTIYCGCDWQWVGRSGGRIEPERCGYRIRAIANRGQRTEIEHIFAASHFGQQRQCWQNGGRKNCNQTDPVFNRMEADLHNLTVSIGELNADRSNYRFGMLPNSPQQHGQCTSKVDFKKRIFEPRDEAKGQIARVNFYMADHYNLRLSEQQQKLFMAWSKQYPVSPWERTRDQRIAQIMGHHNPFVTGEKTWRLGHRNSGNGLSNSRTLANNSSHKATPASAKAAQASATPSNPAVRGNRNSKIFHPKGCASYNSMHPRNIVDFKSESAALQSGYRKAKNCN